MIDTLIETNAPAPTAADTSAARNFAANLRALRLTQPALGDDLANAPADVEWIFARDGSLTAMEESQRWWAGCSLPARAAEFMLRNAELPGTVICFLLPVHAGQLRVALDRMLAGQALLALTPDLRAVGVMFACAVSNDIAAHRLYIAAGARWEIELDRLLEANPGLPTPTQFIRPILADSAPADALVAPAQKIFADHSARRAQRVKALRQGWSWPGLRRICLIAPSHFRLWDDIGAALAGAMEDRAAGISVSCFDPDDPASASPAAMAAVAATCDAIVAPNSSRADLPDLVPDAMPWATWLTVPRIPSPHKVGKWDTLLVADPRWKDLAIEHGWDAGRIFVAGWPDARPRADVSEEPSSPGVFRVRDDASLAIIADTRPLDPPPRVTEYSSHRLLWEAIAEQLRQNPFALVKSADEFLSDWMHRVRVEEEGFDRATFLDGIVLHAWQQGIARVLLRAGIAVKLFGSGWPDLDEFRAAAAGPIRTREQLHRAVACAAALVHIWPISHAHPIESAGRPIVRAHQSRDAFLREAKLALGGRISPVRGVAQAVNAQMILRALSMEN